MFLQVGEELKEKKMRGKDRKEEAEVSERTACVHPCTDLLKKIEG